MPTYEHKCERCGEITEEIRELKNYNVNIIKCNYCGGKAYKIFSVPITYETNPDIKAEEKFAAMNNAVIREPGMAGEVLKNRKYKEEKQDKVRREIIANTVRDFV